MIASRNPLALGTTEAEIYEKACSRVQAKPRRKQRGVQQESLIGKDLEDAVTNKTVKRVLTGFSKSVTVQIHKNQVRRKTQNSPHRRSSTRQGITGERT